VNKPNYLTKIHNHTVVEINTALCGYMV